MFEKDTATIKRETKAPKHRFIILTNSIGQRYFHTFREFVILTFLFFTFWCVRPLEKQSLLTQYSASL